MEKLALVTANVEVVTPFMVHARLTGVVGTVMVTLIWANAGAAASKVRRHKGFSVFILVFSD
jgi:hypothetical protein